MNNLSTEHRSDLETSGWSTQTIESSGIYSVPPGQIDKILGGGHKSVRSLMAIPYPGTDFVRYKLFPPSKLSSKDEKLRKYHQAPGSPLVLYQPAGFDPEADVIRITEGEKKAGKGTQEGLNVCGLGGIWNFANRDEDAPPELIEDLQEIEWKGKTAELIPDADFQIKAGVRHAVYRLGNLLEQQGASVKIVRLPDNQKLDDYLCNQPVEKFVKLDRLSLEDSIFRPEALKEKGLEHAIWDSMIGIGDFDTMELPPQQIILKPWLKERTFAMVHSQRGVGKTMLGLGIGLAVARKGGIGPWKAENPVPTIYLDGEMTAEELKDRIQGLSKNMPAQVAPFLILSNDIMARKGWPRINLTKEETRNALTK
ncbi:MAG: DUF3854 domain-containing protein, partial [Methanoregulaceae archaeon]|nr:DUF3854 domain-containing protein [Methanoregulaceae archaeon]